MATRRRFGEKYTVMNGEALTLLEKLSSSSHENEARALSWLPLPNLPVPITECNNLAHAGEIHYNGGWKARANGPATTSSYKTSHPFSQVKRNLKQVGNTGAGSSSHKSQSCTLMARLKNVRSTEAVVVDLQNTGWLTVWIL